MVFGCLLRNGARSLSFAILRSFTLLTLTATTPFLIDKRGLAELVGTEAFLETPQCFTVYGQN
jgi:hypothetical protein